SDLRRDVDILWRRRHVTGSKDPTVGGALMFIDADESILVSGDTCGWQVEMICRGTASGGHQQALSTDPLSRNGAHLGLILLLGHGGGVFFDHRDPIVGQGVAEDGRYLRLGRGGDPTDNG